MNNKDIAILSEILVRLNNLSIPEFRGLGLILYNDYANLPVSPLRNSLPEGVSFPIFGVINIIELLCKISQKSSIYHDGFHLLSSGVSITHVCQYFSPPINNSASLDYTKGGRYRAAQYGSYLREVDAIGIFGEEYDSYIFIKGNSIQL